MTTTIYGVRTYTARQFKARAERMFRSANSDCAKTATIEWEFLSRPCKGADGRTYRNGYFTVSAPGYRTRRMSASACMTTDSGWMVR